MEEFVFITQSQKDPIVLIVLGVLIVWKILETLIKYIPFFFKKKKKSVEEMFEEDAQERKIRQAEVDKRFDSIETELEKLVSIVADHEETFNTLSQGTLENMVFNEELSPFRRLKAFRRLIAIKGNGRAKKKGMEIIVNNKEMWLDVLDIKMPLKIIDQYYYDSVLAEIDRRILN